MTEKEFIPYEQALALKELGFDEPCIAYATLEYSDVVHCGIGFKIHKESDLPTKPFGVPTWQSAFRWFREKYGLPSHIATYWQHDWNNYSYQYYFVQDKVEWNGIEHYKTYEEAELKCLIELIKITKTK